MSPWHRMRPRSSRATAQWLIVGLGNPGPRYGNTPHNVGFEVVDRYARREHAALSAKHKGQFAVTSVHGTEVALLKPLTFMNLSGESVGPACRSLSLDPTQVIVVHDEADLAFGDVRVKHGGGLAGHNGLKSIAAHLGSQEFTRVRIGVGRPEPGDRRPLAVWILAQFDPVVDTEPLYSTAIDAVDQIIVGDAGEPA